KEGATPVVQVGVQDERRSLQLDQGVSQDRARADRIVRRGFRHGEARAVDRFRAGYWSVIPGIAHDVPERARRWGEGIDNVRDSSLAAHLLEDIVDQFPAKAQSRDNPYPPAGRGFLQFRVVPPLKQRTQGGAALVAGVHLIEDPAHILPELTGEKEPGRGPDR